MMVKILAYQEQYLPDLKEIFFENVPRYFAAREWEDLVDYLERHGDTYYLLLSAGEVIGAGGFHYPDEKTGRLSWDFLSEKAKGKGLGRRLIEHCLEKMMLGERLEKIEVWTSQHACAFYQKFGFQTVRTEKDHWGEGLDLYLMERSAGGDDRI